MQKKTDRVEQALPEESAQVMGLIDRCRAALCARQVFQWEESYPTLPVVEADAQAGELFVIRESGRCVAGVCLNEVQPAQYLGLPWRRGPERALVVHRLCADPAWQGKGLGNELMAFAEKLARRVGVKSIRLDAYTGSPSTCAWYERLGYVGVGEVMFPRRLLPFRCYEKVI